MSHPDELLAEYVDGALSDRDRATVDAHLAGCERCRDEVSLARASVARLGDLPELAAPAGSASEALLEAGADRRPRAAGSAAAARPPRWSRWIPAAAAAVLIGLLVITLPRLGHHAEQASAPRNPFSVAASGAATPPGEALGQGGPVTAVPGAQDALDAKLSSGVRLEQQAQNYKADDIQQLLERNASRFVGARVPAATSFGAMSTSTAGYLARVEGADAKAAFTCVSSQVTSPRADALVELIQAEYEGAPAYLAVFVESPAPGKPANEVIAWVVRKDGCTIANFAYRRL